MSLQEYNLLVMLTIFHELAHTFTKIWFSDIDTPFGVGIGCSPGSGEAGWLVEERFMGGRLQAEWDDQNNFMYIDRIECLLLKVGADSFSINDSLAKKILASLCGNTFHSPLKAELGVQVPFRQHSIRARITEVIDIPQDKKKIHGLGYRSFIGEDKGPAFFNP